jgi:hypothetical protein
MGWRGPISSIWFVGAVIGHDLVLMPLYSIADWSVLAAVRHRAPNLPAVPWINYLRVPAGLSALLLLVWFPLILRLKTRYQASTTLSPDPFLWHWLAVTGALFLLSATAYALRLRAAHALRLPLLGLECQPLGLPRVDAECCRPYAALARHLGASDTTWSSALAPFASTPGWPCDRRRAALRWRDPDLTEL